MLKKLSFMILILSFTILFISACTGGTKSPIEASDGELSLARPTPPASFVDLRSPKLSAADINRGQQLYKINCMTCHGEKGMGDGPAAAALDPKPEPLAVNESTLSDAYMFWRISDGGQSADFKSAMPAWKSILSDEQIWQIIGYLRDLGG